MEFGTEWLAPAEECSYLPDQTARMQYLWSPAIDASGYLDRMNQGWRRFGTVLMRPRCQGCSECRSLRVDVARFRPDRSQKRALKAAQGVVEVELGEPTVCPERMALYLRHHHARSHDRGWDQGDRSVSSYIESFVNNPFPTEEWRYRIGGKLVSIGYADHLPGAMSAIYCFYDPDHVDLSLGTFNVLTLIETARRREIPYLYLGYHVSGCISLAYKARFRPNQILGRDGLWADFLD